METFYPSLIFLSLVLARAAKIFPTAQYFELAGSTAPSVKLSWFDDSNANQYSIYRKLDEAQFQLVASVFGNTYDDYQVPSGQLDYIIVDQNGQPDPSNQVQISTKPPAASHNFLTFDNIEQSTLRTISKIKLRETYFQYSVQNDQQGVTAIVEATSSDGFNFSKETRVVLTGKEVCEGNQQGCKLEAVSFEQNPKTLEVLMWAHWEYKQGYDQARVAVAFGMPGGAWKFGGAFRPLGNASRDLTFFLDDDGTGYLLSSTAMNTDLNIYKLSPDLHSVESLVATVLKGQKREAPSLIKHDNIYYLFTSQASGWYPSLGQYISASNLAGPWSESRNIGNLAGFGAQSGGVRKLGATYVMCANQWKGQWRDPEPPNRQIILPISLRDGWAQYYFYERLRYLDDDKQGGVFGIQSGKLLTGTPKAASGASKPGSGANISLLSSAGTFPDYFRQDLLLFMPTGILIIFVGSPLQTVEAINLDPAKFYKPSAVPFEFTIDFGGRFSLRQFDLTTKLVCGSETAYHFTISGAESVSGPFELIVNRTSNTRPGFVTSSVKPSTRPYRYVKLDLKKVTKVHDHQKADWAVGVHQFTTYGEPADAGIESN